MAVESTEVVGVACEACGVDLWINSAVGTIESPRGSRRLTYADDALAVWDCPACGHADAMDLLGS